jgi:hypothetical protein
MSAEVLAPSPPGWPEWVVTTKSRWLELGVTTNFSQVRGVKANTSARQSATRCADCKLTVPSMRLFAGKRPCSRRTTCSARDARGRAVIESLDAVQLTLSDDGLRRLTGAGALTAVSDSDTQPVD